MIPNGKPCTVAAAAPPKPPRFFPLLRPGQLLRLEQGGPVHTVIRVTPGAAYVAPGDWLDEAGRPLVRPWNQLLAIAARAAVWPAEVCAESGEEP